MRDFLKLRSNILKVILVAAMTVIVIRLFMIQIVKHDYYVAQAEAQHTMQNTLLAKRGEIYILDGDEPVPIVMNSKVWTVILDPQVAVYERDKIEKTFNELIKDNLVAKYNDVFDSEYRYYIVARNVPYKQAQQIKEAELSGVFLQATTKRVYPENKMAAGLLGFVNSDGVGQYGVEGALNEDLAGKNGVLKTVKDVNNIPLTIGDDNVKIPAEDGKNIVLTIDRNIQNKVEQVLAAKLKKYKVSYGSVIVMNPNTGEVLAMASLPDYDAANYSKVEDASVFQTDVTMDAYEPASVCKTFAMAAAIDMGKMTPKTTYQNNGYTVVDGWKIWNSLKNYRGVTTMQYALNMSFNTGSTQALRLLGDSEIEITEKGKKRLYDYYYNKFWFGRETGIEVAESPGLIISPDDVDGTDARYANMTFGQGFNITLLHLAAAYSSVVNGGEYYKPTVVAGEMKNKEFVKKDTTKPDHETISKATSDTMREMLVGVRKTYGGAKNFDGKAYVGGKTGTAQAIRNGKYVMDETIATYAGFGAASKDSEAKYIVIAKVWEKGKNMDGGAHARPIFDEISKYLIDYYKLSK